MNIVSKDLKLLNIKIYKIIGSFMKELEINLYYLKNNLN